VDGAAVSADVRVFERAALAEEAARFVYHALNHAVAARGRASLALSGGSSPVPAYAALAKLPVPWAQVDLFFVDERCVPPDHPDSNFRLVQQALLAPLGKNAPRVFRMEGERADPDAAARDYEASLPAALDVVVIGVGEDGHTASLFPGSPLLDERTRRVAAVFDSPKPPPRRLTLTLPALRAARTCLGIVQGAGKRDAVAALRMGRPLIPAARVPGAQWWVDPDAAGE
jgi:6-phosphogluconolactonase